MGFFLRAGGIFFGGITKNLKNRQALPVFAERGNRLSGTTGSFKDDSERKGSDSASLSAPTYVPMNAKMLIQVRHSQASTIPQVGARCAGPPSTHFQEEPHNSRPLD
jgi:hypothetical protein